MEDSRNYIDDPNYVREILNQVYLAGCRHYELNLEKINSVDDCKKILKFLCDLTIKPTPEGTLYNGFEEVEQYFDK